MACRNLAFERLQKSAGFHRGAPDSARPMAAGRQTPEWVNSGHSGRALNFLNSGRWNDPSKHRGFVSESPLRLRSEFSDPASPPRNAAPCAASTDRNVAARSITALLCPRRRLGPAKKVAPKAVSDFPTRRTYGGHFGRTRAGKERLLMAAQGQHNLLAYRCSRPESGGSLCRNTGLPAFACGASSTCGGWAAVKCKSWLQPPLSSSVRLL
jgi:hypothetical protein